MKRYDRARFVRVSNIIGGACNIANINDDYDSVLHEVAHATLLFGRVFHGMQDRISFAVNRLSLLAQNTHEVETCALQRQACSKLGFTMGRRALLVRLRESLQPEPRESEPYRTQPSPREVSRRFDRAKVKPKHVDYIVSLYHSTERFLR